MPRRDPTIQDFANLVQHHLDEALKRAHLACQAIERQRNAEGRLRSGNTIIACFDAAYAEFDKGIAATLGALAAAEETGVLDTASLDQTVRDRLTQFAGEMRHCCKAPLFREWELVPNSVLDEKEEEFEKKIAFALSQYECGNLKPPKPDIPQAMKNEINIDTMMGGAVQQGTTGSTQTAYTTVNIAQIREAFAAVEKALAENPPPENVAAEIDPEIQTIKAQLAKAEPSVGILRQVGASLRKVTEGASGALLAHGVLEAIEQLVALL